MERTEYNEICLSRGYVGLANGTYVKEYATVCTFYNGEATVYPHCAVGFHSDSNTEYVGSVTIDEIYTDNKEDFIEALNKFEKNYKITLNLIHLNRIEQDFEDVEDEYDM